MPLDPEGVDLKDVEQVLWDLPRFAAVMEATAVVTTAADVED